MKTRLPWRTSRLATDEPSTPTAIRKPRSASSPALWFRARSVDQDADLWQAEHALADAQLRLGRYAQAEQGYERTMDLLLSSGKRPLALLSILAHCRARALDQCGARPAAIQQAELAVRLARGSKAASQESLALETLSRLSTDRGVGRRLELLARQKELAAQQNETSRLARLALVEARMLRASGRPEDVPAVLASAKEALGRELDPLYEGTVARRGSHVAPVWWRSRGRERRDRHGNGAGRRRDVLAASTHPQ